MEHRRHLITRESRDTLEYSDQAKSVGKITNRREEKPKWIFEHLRIGELIVIFIGEDIGRRNQTRECIFGRGTGI